jgi:transketolase
MTHDSVFVGEDGPTHQPVEQLATVRAMPNVSLIRPADANETSYAWLAALRKQDGPTVLCFTRQNVPVLDRAKCAPASGVLKGAYTLYETKPGQTPEIILIGTGSEVAICFEAAIKLGAEGRAIRVVSMPSWDLFEAQPQTYKDSVLPPQIKRRIVVEAGISMGWERYIGPEGKMISRDHYGASAPYERLAKEFGFTAENVVSVARSFNA